MKTSRLEAFADGVFTIAATLLIIEVSVDVPGNELGSALLHAWPQYAAYAVSFLTIGIWWVNHHTVMDVVDHANRTFLFMNIAFLSGIAFLPFPTKLVAQHFRDDGARAAVLTFGMTMTYTALFATVLWFYAANKRKLISPSANQKTVDHISRSVMPGVPINAAATLLAIWNPRVAIILMSSLALFYVVGASLTERE